MKIVALAGGVGAARFLRGVTGEFIQKDLTVVVNTGDDFEWMGLHVSPDLDTIIYTLAGIENPETGWGIRGDSFNGLARLKELSCETWFHVGDRDMATHVYRSRGLRNGKSLSEVTRELTEKNGIDATVLPMSDSPIPTLVHTDEGTLSFQEYFVHRQCRPRVRGFTFEGIEASRPAPGVLDALDRAECILLCPSNPFVSLGPILALPGIREKLHDRRRVVVAVTPIIGEQAVKGPAASMLRDLGWNASALSIAKMYRDILAVFVLDRVDSVLEQGIRSMDVGVVLANTRMTTAEDSLSLARAAVGALR